jgi:hypothetical protein
VVLLVPVLVLVLRELVQQVQAQLVLLLAVVHC